MMKELKEMWKKGYQFIEGSCYGESIIEDFEDVEDTLEEVEEDEWLSLKVDINHEQKMVSLFVINDD